MLGRCWAGAGWDGLRGPGRDRGSNCGEGCPPYGLTGRGLGSFEVSGDGSGDRSIRGTSEGEGGGGNRRGRGEWLRDRGPRSREGPLDQSRRGGA